MTSSVLRDGRTGDCQDGRLQYAPKTSDLTVSLPGRLPQVPSRTGLRGFRSARLVAIDIRRVFVMITAMIRGPSAN